MWWNFLSHVQHSCRNHVVRMTNFDDRNHWYSDESVSTATMLWRECCTCDKKFCCKFSILIETMLYMRWISMIAIVRILMKVFRLPLCSDEKDVPMTKKFIASSTFLSKPCCTCNKFWQQQSSKFWQKCFDCHYASTRMLYLRRKFLSQVQHSHRSLLGTFVGILTNS